MAQNYPDVNYEWAEMPQGTEQATLGFTVSYSIGADSANKDPAWVLLQYLTGPEGMAKWTEGGVALPSRKDVPPPAGKEKPSDQRCTPAVVKLTIAARYDAGGGWSGPPPRLTEPEAMKPVK